MQHDSLKINFLQRFNQLIINIAKAGMTPVNYVVSGFKKSNVVKIFKQTEMLDMPNDSIKIILVSREDKEFASLYNCLLEIHQDKLSNAPYLGIALSKIIDERNDMALAEKNADRLVRTYLTECALNGINSNVLLHNVAGFYINKLEACLTIPQGYKAISMFAIGSQKSYDDSIFNYTVEDEFEENNAEGSILLQPIWNY